MSSPTTAKGQQYGHALVRAYALVYTGIAVSTAIYYRQASRLAAVVRSGLIAMIHEQTLALRSTTNSKNADAVALMGTDTTRIISSMRSLHEIWASNFCGGCYLAARGSSLCRLCGPGRHRRGVYYRHYPGIR